MLIFRFQELFIESRLLFTLKNAMKVVWTAFLVVPTFHASLRIPVCSSKLCRSLAIRETSRYSKGRLSNKNQLIMLDSPDKNGQVNSGNYADSARDGDGIDSDVSLEDVEGLIENSNVRPKLDIDADERLLIHQLRKQLHKDDFDRIFNSKDRRIGEII